MRNKELNQMENRRDSWYKSAWFVRMAQVLGLLEMSGGLALLEVKHDGEQGYALLAIGAATFGSMPWVSRVRSS
jgi:hypothetical protein